MSRLFVALLSMLLCCLVLTGCSGKSESSGSDLDSLGQDIVIIPSALPENFTIKIPGDFTTTSSASFDEYYVKDDASIIITDDPIAISGEKVETYMKKVKEAYEKTADQYEVYSEEYPTIHDTDACILEFGYAIVGADAKQAMRCMTAVLIHHDVAYVITCKSRAETFGLYRQAFRACIDSIRIETPPIDTDNAVIH
ncbi:MAG: hypothetical protein IKM30_06615 [Oscillospiraceae bacterium]|nr:hypothetical protein [Oscillospiraceae bacterium]